MLDALNPQSGRRRFSHNLSRAADTTSEAAIDIGDFPQIINRGSGTRPSGPARFAGTTPSVQMQDLAHQGIAARNQVPPIPGLQDLDTEYTRRPPVSLIADVLGLHQRSRSPASRRSKRSETNGSCSTTDGRADTVLSKQKPNPNGRTGDVRPGPPATSRPWRRGHQA